MSAAERRNIEVAPGHQVDQAGAVFHIVKGNARRVHVDARGFCNLHISEDGKPPSSIVANVRELHAMAFPEDVSLPEPKAPEPEVMVAAIPDMPGTPPEARPKKERARGRGRVKSEAN